MKKIINVLSVLMVSAALFTFAACSSPSGSGSGGSSGGGTYAPENPFDGTSWYGDTKDILASKDLIDVKLLVFDKTDYNGATIYRCENVEGLYFGGEDHWRLTKGNKLPYSVEKKSDGSYVATTQIFKYTVVIPSATSNTGYIAVEHNNKTLTINITKK